MQGPKLTTLISILLFSTSSNADFVGLNIGSTFWGPDLAGTLNSSSVSDDINVDGGVDTHPNLVVSLEHPIPLLPNVKLQNHDLSSTGADSTTGITFGGTTFTNGISLALDLSHQDIVLYYELLDNWVNIDFGLNLKTFEGEITVSDNLNSDIERLSIDETIPLLYLAARIDLPFTGFYVAADIQNLSLSDSSVEDSTLMVGYENPTGFGVEGGYKKFSLNLDDAGSINTAIEYNGVYINGYIHF